VGIHSSCSYLTDCYVSAPVLGSDSEVQPSIFLKSPRSHTVSLILLTSDYALSMFFFFFFFSLFSPEFEAIRSSN